MSRARVMRERCNALTSYARAKHIRCLLQHAVIYRNTGLNLVIAVQRSHSVDT